MLRYIRHKIKEISKDIEQKRRLGGDEEGWTEERKLHNIKLHKVKDIS